MSPDIRTLLTGIGRIGILAGALLILTSLYDPEIAATQSETFQQEVVVENENVESVASIAATLPEVATSTPKPAAIVPIKPKDKPVATAPTETTPENMPRVIRVPNPYSTAPKNFTVVNEETRAALVNILCSGRGGSLRPISGSGIIVDPKGIILTNAHVAQYVLLAADSRVNLSCVIRTGSPARAAWVPEVLYIPPVWIHEHASDITAEKPVGTGEYDYALLRIASSIDGSPLPLQGFAYVSPDVREAVGFVSDPALVASYPAEFLGNLATQSELYPVSSVTTIQEFFTFSDKSVDVISVGSVIGAQSGSSGGAIVNAWGRLLGIISTTSEGTTTADRDLRAVTLSYINRDITARSGSSLAQILATDPQSLASQFNSAIAPALRELLLEALQTR